MRDQINTIKNIFSVAGYENNLTSFIMDEIKAYGDECYTDKLGNLIFHKKGNGEKLLINVPVSSNGLFISYITDDGKAKIKTIGNLESKNILGKKVRDNNGENIGIIMADKKDVNDEDDLYIDFGVFNKEDVTVKVGDILEITEECFLIGENIYGYDLGRALNILSHIDIIKSLKTDYDLYYAFTVMDNIGFKGAKTAAFSIDPDIAITCFLSYTDLEETEVKINKGAVVRIKDSHIIVNKKLRDAFIKKLSDKNLSYQIEILTKDGLTNNEIMYLNHGILTANVNIPVKGKESNVECVNISDFENYKKCILEIVR